MDYFKLCAILKDLSPEFRFGAATDVFEDGNLDNKTIDAIFQRYYKKGRNDYIANTFVLLSLLKAIPEELRERPEDKETDA